MFACHFSWYTFTRLPLGVVPVSDMFQQKIDEIFKGLSNLFGTADDMFIIGYDADSRDHDKTLRQVIQICQPENLKLNRNMSFQVHYNTIFRNNLQKQHTTRPKKYCIH